MADPAGGLNIRLAVREGRVWAEIRSGRPLGASSVFAGRTLAETATRLPALYSLCATAQATACLSALEAARGRPMPAAILGLRALLVDAETVKEHLWRVLLDWPRRLGEPPDALGMGAVMRAYAAVRAALAAGGDPLALDVERVAPHPPAARLALAELGRLTAERVLGLPPADWLEVTAAKEGWSAWSLGTQTPAARLVRMLVKRGWEGRGRSEVPALPELAAADLEPPLAGSAAAGFIAAPTWEGAPRETSAFTRQRSQEPVAGLAERFGNGLLPRLAATLVELAVAQNRLSRGLLGEGPTAGPLAASPAAGVGLAQVPAARGLLVHRVAVAGDRVRDYRILAPTEWNFHPQGALAQGLAGLPVADAETLRCQVGLLVTALDPCVDYHVDLC